MRWSFLLLVLVIPAIAMARPTVAVAPLDGDDGGKIAEIVADAAEEDAKVTRQDRVQRDMEKLSVTDFDKKAVKRLRNKLVVDVLIFGKVSKKHLELTIAGKGKNRSKLELDFKSTKALKKALAAKLGKRIDEAAAQADDDDDDDERRREDERRKKDEDDRRRAEDERRKKDDDDRRRKDDDDRRRRTSKRDDDDDDRRRRTSKRDDDDDDRRRRTSKRDDDDDDRRRRTSKRDDDDGGRRRTSRRDDNDEIRRGDDDDDDDGGSRRRRRRGDDDTEARPRHRVTQAAVWLDAGAGFARRTFTYEASGTMRPPPVGTAAPDGRIAGEIYPAAFSTLKGPAAGFGLAASYDRAFALGIAVPGTTVTTPIKSGSYSIGARYRFTFSGASVAAGVALWGRYYIADRSGLMMATQLDMPDVNYKGVAPQLVARVPFTPKIGGYLMVDLPLMYDAGAIQKGDNYGSAKITAFDVRAGAQIMLGPHYALQINGGYDQVNLKFDASQGTMAAARGVSAAADKTYGLAVTLGILY